MGIRLKLLSVILILVVSFVISASTYFGVVSAAARIQSEEQSLTNLKIAFLHESGELNKLASANYSVQLPAFRNAVTETDNAFTLVAGLRLLPKASPSVAAALKSIVKLKSELDRNTLSFLSVVSILRNDAFGFGFDPDRLDFFELVTSDSLRTVAGGQQVIDHARDFLNQMGILSQEIDASVKVIDEQYSLIDGAIAQIRLRTALVSLSIILLLVAATVLIGIISTNRIVRAIRLIEANIARIRGGDLTQVFAAGTKDEIGRLSANLNDFLSSLRETLRGIQGVSVENVGMKQNLLATTEQTSSSAHQIAASTASITRRIASLDENLGRSSSSVEEIATSIAALNDQIAEQSAMVEESTASVTEMIASVDNVAKISARRREAAERLVRIFLEGGEKVNATLEAVGQISRSLDSIREITAIIENISSQTNLLAMNAAIEAAHAGEAGRGFSVVADEIRKLAEASAANSQGIGRILREIVDRIEDATSSGADTNEALAAIDREIKEMAKSFLEIAATTEELRAGGSQILQAMTALREVSSGVMASSTTINESSGEISSTMGVVQGVSSEVRTGMTEIARGVDEISRAVTGVLSAAGRLGEQSDALNGRLSSFKTG